MNYSCPAARPALGPPVPVKHLRGVEQLAPMEGCWLRLPKQGSA